MKNKIIKSFCFTLILLIISIILSHIVIPKKNMREYGMINVSTNGILGEKEKSIDVLIIGNSESYYSITPMKMWEDYGYTSYVCGSPRQVLPESLIYTHKAMKKQKPKFLILEANNIYEGVDRSVPFEKLINYIMPLAEYHNRWKTLKREDFTEKKEYSWTDDFKGYMYSTEVQKAEDTNYMEYTDENNIIPRSNKLYVKFLKWYCNKNNIELIIISTPSAKNWNYKNHNGIEKFASDEKIEFIDMNLIQEDIQIDWNKDTKDAGDHLNYEGAYKVTEYLGKYLNEKNVLKNHKEDFYYNEWNETLKRYKLQINEQI